MDSLTVTSSLENLQAKCSGKNIKYLEHVQLGISLTFTRRGDLEVNLTSPLGTTSRLIQYRPRDNFTTLKNWKILTLHHWGENPTGVWKLTLKNSQPQRRNTGRFLFCYIIYISVFTIIKVIFVTSLAQPQQSVIITAECLRSVHVLFFNEIQDGSELATRLQSPMYEKWVLATRIS